MAFVLGDAYRYDFKYLQRILHHADRGIPAIKTKISTVKIREIFRTYM
jgi:hypothetical protein